MARTFGKAAAKPSGSEVAKVISSGPPLLGRAPLAAKASATPNGKLGGPLPRKNIVADLDTIALTNAYRVDSPDGPTLCSLIRGATQCPLDHSALTHDAAATDAFHMSADTLSILMSRKPKPWRDTTERLRSTYMGRAMTVRDVSSPYAFSLRIEPLLFTESVHPLDSLHRRMRDHLKRRLKRLPDLWFLPEFENGELHIHGMIDVRQDEASATAEALRAAGGFVNSPGLTRK